MSYSFTEKKRIRKSFAKRASVLPIPFLLATQIESYAAFLQAQVDADRRDSQGLQAAFMSIFPIESHSRNARPSAVRGPLSRRDRLALSRPSSCGTATGFSGKTP